MLYVSPCYCTNLRRAAGAVTEYYDAALQPLGLSAAQYYLLINLSRLEPVNTTDWARWVGLERSTLVRNVHLLEQWGWVEDHPSGRGHRFCLSEAGRALLERAVPLWESTQAEVVRQLGQEDAAELMRLLKRVQSLKKEESL